MSKMIDINCSVEFPSEALYLAHKKAGHQGGLEKATPLGPVPTPTPPPGIPASAMPSEEFMETVKRLESKREETPVLGHPTPSQHPSELPPAEPIRLTYLFTGVCPDDRSPIDTLELDVDKKHFCVAICRSCKKQLETREVEKL